MLTVSVDRDRLSAVFKANVTVVSDSEFTAIEARATKVGAAYGRGVGVCLLSDDVTASSGVVSLGSAVKTYSFDVESSELQTDGEYRVSVYVMDASGVWNDTCALYTSSGEAVVGSDGVYILAKRDGSGTDSSYTSAYSGADIDEFVGKVIL